MKRDVMKKIFFFLLVLVVCARLYAGTFKIVYGNAGPQSMTNIELRLITNTPPYYSLVTTGSVSPTDYSPTDSSVSFSYPDGYQQIIFHCNIPVNDDLYSLVGSIFPNIHDAYTLRYNSTNDIFFLS